MPKKWVTLKEFVDLCGRKIVAKSLGDITVSCVNNYLYKGTEPVNPVKKIAWDLGVKEWWEGEVPIPPKVKKEDIEQLHARKMQHNKHKEFMKYEQEKYQKEQETKPEPKEKECNPAESGGDDIEKILGDY